MSRAMKLGMTFGYWAKGPNPDVIEQAQVAEGLGFDSLWTAESWGNDAFTYAAWIAAHTKRVRIGTGIVQMVVSSSDSECPDPRWLKAGTANPPRARWLAPGNTLRSSVACCVGRTVLSISRVSSISIPIRVPAPLDWASL